jgi:uncharacterized protein (TIGR02271 family)
MCEVNSPNSNSGEPDTCALSLVEETAKIEKRRVTSGRVVVKTVVETEEQLLREALSKENVDVERILIDRVVDVAPQVRTEGDVTIIPVLEERLVVEKQLVLLEEVRIRRHSFVETVEVPVTLRKQRASVERLDSEAALITDPAKKTAPK